MRKNYCTFTDGGRQITSQHTKDQLALALSSPDFVNGSLPVDSYIRPSRIFTADKAIIIRKAGTVRPALMAAVVQQIIAILQ